MPVSIGDALAIDNCTCRAAVSPAMTSGTMVRLVELPDRLAICRLDASADVPGWAAGGSFTSVTRTGRELSVVAAESSLPADVQAARGWTALEVAGPLPLSQVGVLASLAGSLAQVGVSIFVVATYDTDYLLVRHSARAAAVAALLRDGHEIVPSDGAVVLRQATAADHAFLWQMLAEAAHESTVRAVADTPDVAKYLTDWPRVRESGLLALDADSGSPLGAAWLRLWSPDDAGYGFVDDNTPEVSVAVARDHRGRGVGTVLLSTLLAVAGLDYERVSLSVRRENPALRLYQRLGFTVVEASAVGNRDGGESVTMTCEVRNRNA